MPQPRNAFPALVCAVALAVSGTSSAQSGAACAGQSLIPRRGNIARIARVTLCLINRQRTAHGLRPLRLNGALARSARAHSSSMVAHRYFSHDSLDGASPFHRIHRSGYGRACALGENIAAGVGRLGTPGAIVRAWMNSPGHRANILNPRYRDTGLGVAYGFPGLRRRGATFTEDLGQRC